MKKIIPILIIGLFLGNFVYVGATSIEADDGSSDLAEVQIIQLSDSHLFTSGEQPIVHTVNYKEPKKNLKFKVIEQGNNFEKVPGSYQTHDYVIITDSGLFPAIVSSNFISWKTYVGFNIKIVNITDSEISSQQGSDLPEKIRSFLRQYYQSWGIQFVLIVGNHATIPMRYCYPDPSNHRFDIFDWTSGEVPTDYYYADLSSADEDSWDYDGDGYYGEYGQDLPDFFPEVYVGRIPVNSHAKITYTLNKLVSFEQDTGSWKQHALHAGAFFYFTNEDHSGHPAMDGAVLSHYIETDIMDGWTISHYSEQLGLEKSVYPWPALTHNAFIDDWRTGQYCVVNWQGHGWTNMVARKVWSWDDGDGVPEGNEIDWPNMITINSHLDDDYPSVVTAESCYVGCPEPASGGNLGIDLLTNPDVGAAIGVVASARSPYGTIDWPNNPGGSDSIIYEFNRFMINDSKGVGEALYDSKYFCNLHYGWTNWAEYLDLYTFNLYGDPSLKIAGIELGNYPPDMPTIDGPSKGTPGTEYTFSIVASDPDNDSLMVKWDWGDGTTSDWLGPFVSGSEVSDSHIWETKGSYSVSVVVEDEHEAQVTASLEVSMPKSQSYILFIDWIFQRFPLIANMIELFLN
jgi:hypothetical protein